MKNVKLRGLGAIAAIDNAKRYAHEMCTAFDVRLIERQSCPDSPSPFLLRCAAEAWRVPDMAKHAKPTQAALSAFWTCCEYVLPLLDPALGLPSERGAAEQQHNVLWGVWRDLVLDPLVRRDVFVVEWVLVRLVTGGATKPFRVAPSQLQCDERLDVACAGREMLTRPAAFKYAKHLNSQRVVILQSFAIHAFSLVAARPHRTTICTAGLQNYLLVYHRMGSMGMCENVNETVAGMLKLYGQSGNDPAKTAKLVHLACSGVQGLGGDDGLIIRSWAEFFGAEVAKWPFHSKPTPAQVREYPLGNGSKSLQTVRRRLSKGARGGQTIFKHTFVLKRIHRVFRQVVRNTAWRAGRKRFRQCFLG